MVSSDSNFLRSASTSTSNVTFKAIREVSRAKRIHAEPRTEVLNLAAMAGLLASKYSVTIVPVPQCASVSPSPEVEAAMGNLLLALFQTADACSLNLYRCVKAKLALNAKKYPVELCKGKSGKYTRYSNETGITKTVGQSTVDDIFESASSEDIDIVSIQEVSAMITKFAVDRQWEQYHTERNLMLALIGEMGELAELFQWKGDDSEGAPIGLTSWSQEEKDKVGQELADVSIYLLRLAVQSNIDIGKAAMCLE